MAADEEPGAGFCFGADQEEGYNTAVLTGMVSATLHKQRDFAL